MIGLITAGVLIVVVAETPPNYGCGYDPPLGSAQDEAVTAFRALAFSLTALIAIGVGVMAAGWSRERRARRGDDPRPGIPTLLAATIPVILFGFALLAPNASDGFGADLVLFYFFYGAVAGLFAVPALAVAGLVISIIGRRWGDSDKARANLEAATIVIADGLIVFGLPLAVTLAYLQGGGPLFC